MTPRQPQPPLATRWQGTWSGADEIMTGVARRQHPTVTWWWGGRAVDGQFGAWCYLCERMVITWHRAFPITQEATTAILAHRQRHLEAGPMPLGNDAAGTSPAADAAPTGGNAP